MSDVAVIVKIMPDSPEVDLEAIKKTAGELIEKDGATHISYSEEDVAFGLKAVMVKFTWPEEQDTSMFEDALAGIDNVSSAVTDDYRRAFG